MVRTPCFHCSRAGVLLFPGWGTKIPHPKDKKGNHSFPINKHVFYKSTDVKLHMNRMKEKNHMIISTVKGYPERSVGKECACNARDPSSIPGSGRSTGEGKGYPLQYSGLENFMDCTVHGVAKSWHNWLSLSIGKGKEFHKIQHSFTIKTLNKLGREGIWASLVAQLVKNLPAMQELLVWFWGWEDPLEKEMATHSSILTLEKPMDRGARQAIVHGVTRVGHDLATKPPPQGRNIRQHKKGHKWNAHS